MPTYRIERCPVMITWVCTSKWKDFTVDTWKLFQLCKEWYHNIHSKYTIIFLWNIRNIYKSGQKLVSTSHNHHVSVSNQHILIIFLQMVRTVCDAVAEWEWYCLYGLPQWCFWTWQERWGKYPNVIIKYIHIHKYGVFWFCVLFSYCIIFLCPSQIGNTCTLMSLNSYQ